jgi:hypothetical protein
MKDRFACWNCDCWGDVLDLIGRQHPQHGYAGRQKLLAAYADAFNSFQYDHSNITEEDKLIEAAYIYTKEGGGGGEVHPKRMR